MSDRICRGLTLLEVIISSALLFICIALGVMLFTAISHNFARSKETIDAYNDCQSILEMIITELREADPATITVGESQVRFDKYHKPSEKIQTVTWSFDRNGKKVKRSYTSAGASGMAEFGESIVDLSFCEFKKGISPHESRTVRISIEVEGKIETLGGKRRNIIKLDTEVCIRSGTEVKVNVRFVP